MQQLQENVIKVPAQIRPVFQRDGSNGVLVGLAPDQAVKIQPRGAVQPMSPVTLQEGIEQFAARELPTIRAVEAVV